MPRHKKNIDQLRKEINQIDSSIIDLLAKRRDLSKAIIKAKDLNDLPIRDEKREKELLNRLIAEGKRKGLENEYIFQIYHEIIENSVRLQQQFIQQQVNKKDKAKRKIRIAIQGIEGSYSYLTAKKFFANYEDTLEFLGEERFEDVAKAVEKGDADYAILPIENTTSGGINEVYDILLHTTLSIIGEEKYKVEHCLCGVEKIPLNKIRTIYAHYQAAAQCSEFLAGLKDVKLQYFADTAMSARKIQEEKNKYKAAIASKEAAEVFGVKILKSGIANQPENFTRFLICARKPVTIDKRIPSKTSLVMATSHTAGALVESLMVFRKYNINLTKLESRPIIGNPWEEMFYIDFEGNPADKKVQKAIEEITPFTRFIKVLGSYPSKDLPKKKGD
ncbi:MAG: prephenate dehydratase domain-containing protein [Melioribacteraceae bacterium]|nr:prephenate dehydratase domain-containing protein [Melioribacteraceae bacterium]